MGAGARPVTHHLVALRQQKLDLDVDIGEGAVQHRHLVLEALGAIERFRMGWDAEEEVGRRQLVDDVQAPAVHDVAVVATRKSLVLLLYRAHTSAPLSVLPVGRVLESVALPKVAEVWSGRMPHVQ